ncbi:MAG: pyridoxal phosphate-dependent aminotransferase [Candidatus Thorarchaeota archaeon]|nr:MAG: pyridoxal phosphate-dependent aminotransferase [Candidatus Thorarchaeota archaeon]
MDLGYSQRFNDLMAKGRMKPDLIELSMCDPPRFGFQPDPRVYDSPKMDIPESGYPYLQEELITGIVKRTKTYTGVSEDFDVVISNGCGGAFAILAIALRGMLVGIESPFYSPTYEYFKRTTDLWYIRCKPELNWDIDLDLLRKELEQRKKPGVLFFVSPSNPTGHVHDEKVWRALVNIAGEFNQVLITDEVYDEMSFVPFQSLLPIAKDVPVIYMHGFSKVWRAPEIRVGYTLLYDPEEKCTPLFEDIQGISKLGFGVNPISQMQAISLLNEKMSYRRKQFDEIQRRRDALNDAISKSDNLSSVVAGGATYQYIETPWNDWKVCSELLEQHNILISPGSACDPFIGDKFVRVVFLNTVDNIQKMVIYLDQLF